MSMQSYLATDLSELFARDMPTDCKIGARNFSVLLDDLINEEVEAYGGPENIDLARVHFQTTDKKSIEVGTALAIRQRGADGKPPGPWKSKIVLSAILSADGNELIATVRGD